MKTVKSVVIYMNRKQSFFWFLLSISIRLRLLCCAVLQHLHVCLIWCRGFRSLDVHPCYMVSRCPVLRCPVPRFQRPLCGCRTNVKLLASYAPVWTARLTYVCCGFRSWPRVTEWTRALTVSDKNVANELWLQSMWGLYIFSPGYERYMFDLLMYHVM